MQYILGEEWPERSKPGEYKAFRILNAIQLSHVFRAQDVVDLPDVTGGKLSWYKHGKLPVRQQLIFGRILYFKQYTDTSAGMAKAVLTREPNQEFGTEEFEFNVYKLTAADGTRQEQEYAKLSAAVPSQVKVDFDTRQRASSSRPIKVFAKQPLPQAKVAVLNR